MDVLSIAPTGESTCKGKIFRLREECYVDTQRAYVYRLRMMPLKRKSCPGCKHCEYLREYMDEELSNRGEPYYIDKVVNSGLYALRVYSECVDQETGICDDCSTGFVLLEGGA